MNAFKRTVTFLIEAEDEQQAVNILHAALSKAEWPEEIDYELAYRLKGGDPAAVLPEHGLCDSKEVYPSPKVNYDLLNKVVRRQMSVLTEARGTGDRAKVLAACRAAVREWNEPGMMWPDNWSRWQNALDELYPVFQAPTLESLS